MTRLDGHFLRELFDCPRPATAASLATMMMEELIDGILAGLPANGERVGLSALRLADKIDALESSGLLDRVLYAPMRNLVALHGRNTDDVTLGDYQGLALPDLDIELRRQSDQVRVAPAIQINVALCHLLLRISEFSDLTSKHRHS